MKKYIITIIALLYSFLSANLLFAVPFVQGDLAGTWNMNILRTGFHSDGTTPLNKWVRGKFTISSSGVATCVSMSNSTDSTGCPEPFALTFTMDPSTGVITQTGANAPNFGTDHMTMTSNKNFAAGTATNGSGPGYSYQLVIMQKEVTGTSYGDSDLVSKNFVIHELMVGAQNEWMHDVGYTDASREVWFTSQTRPSGSDDELTDSGSTISVDSNGIVSISGATMTTYQGFMSDDKKTIVGTLTDGAEGSECYHLMIIQITGQTYAAGELPAGTLFSHVLGNGGAPFWVHYTQTVDSSGVMTFSDWLNSYGETTAPDPSLTGNIDASGTVTIDGNSTFHGQVSHDRTFTVSTHTRGTGPIFYMLSVSTKATTTAKNDFNSDGQPDILWRNTSDGVNVIWYMDGVSMTGWGQIPTLNDANWIIAGTGDFNNDTKPDILWRNTSNGVNVVWYMDGVSMTGWGQIPTLNDANWIIAGTGDFNNDTKPDILWRNTSDGVNVIWYMDGVSMTGWGQIPTLNDANWIIAGTGDFNNDTKPDILWRNTSNGVNVVWYMDGVSMTGWGQIPTLNDANWIIAGTGDFNNDTKPDILWRNTSNGVNVVWYMDGVSMTGWGQIPTLNDANWIIVGH